MNSELLLAQDRFDRSSFTWYTLVLHSESIVFSISERISMFYKHLEL
jgi:hypothetical protein